MNKILESPDGLSTETKGKPTLAMIPSLQILEDHASAMASLLESLAQHYDRCSLALKRLELEDSNESEQPTYNDPKADRADMLLVLEKDAAQVDDVVTEIKERLEEMEPIGMDIKREVEDMEAAHRLVLALISDLHTNYSALGNCVTHSRTFANGQKEAQDMLHERLYGLEQLSKHYVFFREAYDALLIEVGRRIHMQRRKEIILADALGKIQAINEGRHSSHTHTCIEAH
jgi:autophagy-related protein 17